jgi:3D (Asp-Asp-Asp) domain-containing protein
MRRRPIFALLLLIGTSTCTVERPQPPAAPAPPPVAAEPTPARMRFTATAYAISGTTKSGAQTRRGIVAADPHVIPLGTRIRVHDAGPYSGEYVVEDTGAKVDGREIDIYMPSTREAREFGRRKVYVEILETERDER